MNIILYILFAITIVLVLYSPKEYNPSFCLLCFLCIIIPAFRIIISDVKRFGFINFNTIYLSSFFLTSFSFAVFIFPVYGTESLLFLFVDQNVINKCTAICATAFLSYCIGYSIKNRVVHQKTILNYQRIEKRIKPIFWFSICSILIFSILFFKSNSDDIQVGLGSYFTLLFLASSSIYLMCKFHTNKDISFISFLKNNSIILLSLGAIALLYLLIGDRGLVIQIGMLIMGLYSIHYKKISLKIVVPLLFSGILLMYAVRITRQGDSSLRTGNINSFIEQNQENYNSEDFNIWTPFSDLTQRYIELYLGYQIQEKEGGYVYPLKIFSILAAPIPFLSNSINNIIYGFPLSATSVGKSIGDYYAFHAGNNGVIAIYTPWGLPGIIIIFILFGYFVKRISINNFSNFYSSVFYIIILCMAVYLPRSSVLDIYRPVVWAYVLIKICNRK